MAKNCFVKKEPAGYVRLKNTTGAKVSAGEFCILGDLGAIAQEEIAIDAYGGFLIGSGTEVQTAKLTDSEDTFDTVDQIVYWNDTAKSFSDKLTVGYYKVGQLKTVKDSRGVIVFTKFEKAEIVATSVADLQAVVVANAALGGRFFKKTAKLTSAAAATPVHLLTDAEVGAGNKAYVSKIYFSVDGATDWATTTTVTLQDTAAVVGATVAVAGLVGNAMIDEGNSNVTLGEAIADGDGFTAGKGLDIAGDANGTGSDLIVTVFGCIM
jgi:hypothetical protein